MRKLKEIFSRQYVEDTAKAFYDENLADKKKRRVFRLKVASIVAPAAFGIGVMAAVKAATIGIATTLAGASTAFTLGAVTAAGAPVAAILIGVTVAMGLTSGVLRNLLDRNVLAKAGNPVPKFWSRENGKAFFAKGNLLTMGLSAAGTLIGGLFIVDFAPQTPSAGPAQTFNSMAEGPVHPITVIEAAPVVEPATAVAADALKADPLTASPAPTALAPAPNPIAKQDTLSELIRSIIAREPAAPTTALDPLAASAVNSITRPDTFGEFISSIIDREPAAPTMAIDPLAASAVKPPPDVVASTLESATSVPDAQVVSEATVDSTGNAAADAQYVDPADAVVAALDKGTTPPPVVVPDAPVNAADGTPAESITVPDKVVLAEVPAGSTPADTPTVTPAADSASTAPAATAEPKAYEGQKVGECTVKEVLTGWFNESSYPPANPTSVFDMECKVAPSAQTGDYIVLNGLADYGQKFGSMVTMEWNRVRDLLGQAELWIAPQVENHLNDHLYGGLGNVQVNASIKPLPL